MQINIHYSASPLLFFCLLLIVWIISIYYYRKTTPPITSFLRFLFFCLRGVVLSLILWLLFRPVLQITRHHQEKPQLAVLTDASASMTVSDGEDSRAFQINQFLKSPIFKQIQKNVSMEFYTFSEQIHPVLFTDSIKYSGSATNISLALDQVLAQERSLPLRGVLLLSDGAHNEGAQPENRSEPWPMPIFTVGIGESQEKPDIILTQVTANEVAYVDQETPIQVSVRGPGFEDRGIEIVLKQGNQEKERLTARLPKGGLETRVTFNWTPDNPGDQRLIVTIDSLAGELTKKNNQREIFIQVRQQKQKVLAFTGSPDPDLAFLKQLLQQDENLDLIVRTQRPDGRFYNGDVSVSDIRSSDVIIFLNFPNRQTSMSSWQILLNTFQNDPKPLFIIAGKSVNFSVLNQLPQDLPVHHLGSPRSNWALPHLTTRGTQHPIPMAYDFSQNLSAWAQLPPVVTVWPDASVMPDAKVLVEGVLESSPGKPAPLLLTRSFQGQKCVMILASQLYRWHMLMWQPDDPQDLLLRLVTNCVRWLSTDESIRPVKLKMENRIYRAGTAIPFRVEVYDETLQPVDQAKVQVQITGPDKFQSTLQSEGNGQYSGKLSATVSGEYQAVAEAVLQGRSLGRDTTTFAITTFQPEFLHTRAHPEVLSRISKFSGGLFVTPDSIHALIQAMQFPMEIVEIRREIKPWQHPLFLIIIVLLLSVEWLMRRRKGMV